MSIASWTSPPASARTFPISRVIRSVSSSLCSRRSSPSRKTISPRRGAGTRRHASNASFAAWTARSTSAAPERGNDASVSPVAGTIDSNVSPPSAATHSPPMKLSSTSVVRRRAMPRSSVDRRAAVHVRDPERPSTETSRSPGPDAGRGSAVSPRRRRRRGGPGGPCARRAGRRSPSRSGSRRSTP